MNLDRRQFLKTAGGAAVAGILTPVPFLSSAEHIRTNDIPRIAIFTEPDFRTIDGFSLSRGDLTGALKGWTVSFLGCTGITSTLTATAFDLLILPYGSAFPEECFPTILKFLKDGGNWLNLGGIPFSVPFVRDGQTWRSRIAQTAFHKLLGITQSFPVDGKLIHSYVPNPVIDGSDELSGRFDAQEIYELYVRFTDTKDYPEEDGSSGSRDASLRPLITGMDILRRRCAVPILQIDRTQGEFSGGRWIFANFRGSIDTGVVRWLAEQAIEGATELTARPSFACYRESEVPVISVQFRHPGGSAETMTHECTVTVFDEDGKSHGSAGARFIGAGPVITGTAEAVTGEEKTLLPGLYTVRVNARTRSAVSGRSVTKQYTTGFWVYDRRLMESGTPLKIGKNYLLRDGKPFPVTGTTYMTSDVHRKFLLEPNPHLWDQDFREMKDAGVNMIRTGIWTGWKNFMLDPGTMNEAAFRALDAFILTARKYDLPLIFTFFAFLPEMWSGDNAYLDPRAVSAQRDFITLIAQRYQSVKDLIWDLINEPSFCNPGQLWKCRPNYDRFEQAAWADWLKKRYPAASETERTGRLCELYRTTPGESASLPALEEFDDANVFTDRSPLKIIDYRLFAQDKFREWAAGMAAVLRANGNSNQLITIGQDEGGTGDRPNPQFFADAVDFTCVHNWWFNDDLVWDSVITTVPGKPNLVEETGVMFYETLEGKAWRTETEVRNLLERKLAIAIGTGGAGYIEWIWNTNPYMKSDNEAAIGFHRADGTLKPEFDAFEKITRFISAHSHLLSEKQDENVLMVIPHSRMFSPRNTAAAATQRCMRVLVNSCHVPVSAVSEYRLASLVDGPRLIILPSPGILTGTAWDRILGFVKKGSTLVVTGPLEGDEHMLPLAIPETTGLGISSKPVAREESLSIDGHDYWMTYRGESLQRIRKADTEEAGHAAVKNILHGMGKILWSPLPVELAVEQEPAAALYSMALRISEINPVFRLEQGGSGVMVLPLVCKDAILYTVISESDEPELVRIVDQGSSKSLDIKVDAQRTAMAIVDRENGQIIAPPQ